MEEGMKVTWREAVFGEVRGRRALTGERVVTGTVMRVRKSGGGTTDYKIDVEEVTGHESGAVKASVWVKRQKLIGGRSWQRSVMKKRAKKAAATPSLP